MAAASTPPPPPRRRPRVSRLLCRSRHPRHGTALPSGESGTCSEVSWCTEHLCARLPPPTDAQAVVRRLCPARRGWRWTRRRGGPRVLSRQVGHRPACRRAALDAARGEPHTPSGIHRARHATSPCSANANQRGRGGSISDASSRLRGPGVGDVRILLVCLPRSRAKRPPRSCSNSP